MTDILSLVAGLERPRLLMQAARHAARDYRRQRALPRLLRETPLPGSCEALLRLIDLEDICETSRLDRSASYAPETHVQVMAAILGEARAIAEGRLTQVKASATSALRRAM